MKRTLLTTVVAALVLGTAGAAFAADLYVAPGGKDGNPGTKAKPLASLQGAVDAVRKLRKAGPNRDKPVLVQFAAGFYPLEKTVQFRPEDSGTKDSPTIYRAAKGASVVISGGRKLTGWKVGADGRWTLSIPESKVSGDDPFDADIWDAFVAKKKIPLPHKGKWEFCQLFINGQRRYRPRFPEKGYVKIGGACSNAFGAKFPGEGHNGMANSIVNEKWKNLRDVEFILMNGWNTERFRVKEAKGRRVHVCGPGGGGVWWQGFRDKRRYFFENVFEAMKPGTFYLDRKAGVVTYQPLPGETPDKCEVIAPKVERLIDIAGDFVAKKPVQYITFEGLTFAHSNRNHPRGTIAAWGHVPQGEQEIDAAIKAVVMQHCTFKGVKIEHTGQYALRIDWGCKHNLVEDCEITDVGGGGLWLGSNHKGSHAYYDPLPEGVEFNDESAASHNTVRNCLIARVGRLHGGSIGLVIFQAHHNLVEHCDIYDTFYAGMTVGWFGPTFNHDNIVQFNEIRLIGQGVLSDMGCIYTLSPSKNTIIRNNILAQCWAYRNNQGCGFYNDQGSQHFTFESNLVTGANDGAYHNHKSTNITLRNNIFALNNGTFKLQYAGRITLTNNIVYRKHGYLFKGGAHITLGNNTWWGGNPKRMGKGSVAADPLFVDAAKGDFRLKPDSPALKAGYKPWDFSKAGRLKGFKGWEDVAKEKEYMRNY